jgi:hypothetical protein
MSGARDRWTLHADTNGAGRNGETETGKRMQPIANNLFRYSDKERMSIDEALRILSRLASQNAGVLTTAVVEADANCQRDRDAIRAASRQLAVESATMTEDAVDARGWFPYSLMRFAVDESSETADSSPHADH